MKHPYLMCLDVHSQFCEYGASTPGGRMVDRGRVPTALPTLRQLVQSLRRPRRVVLEEGPMSGWIYRGLRSVADEIVVCDPRRNALIAKDGDKDDPIDVEKLTQLTRADCLRPVHHSSSESQAAFKQLVALYHDRVTHRVAEANRVIWFLREDGIVVQEAAIVDPQRREDLRKRLPGRRSTQLGFRTLLESYDSAREVEERLQAEVMREGRKIGQIRRFTALPGVAWIRAATFYVYIDTPWRFRSKSALWKYVGIGLERRSSGEGRPRLGVPKRYHRPLKGMILGAAKSAAASKDDPTFADQYRRHLHAGLTPRIARRTVARSMAAVMWGMWKSQTEYRPDWVGVTAADLDTRS